MNTTADVTRNSILIVDDEKSNIMELVHILDGDYKTYIERDSRAAFKTAQRVMPDVILLDIIMPETDGYEVLQALKKSDKTKDTPVIFITGLDDSEAEEKGLALGAADYIVKPFHKAIVRLRIRNQIELVNHMRTLEERDELKRQLEINRELREIAEHSNRVKGEFLSRMSHEMITPMNAIMGMAQIARIKTGDESDECIYQIEKASKHLLGLINDVLDLSGMEYGAFKVNEAPFEFGAMLRKILKPIGYNAAEKQQEFKLNIDSALSTTFISDENRLKQVITTLLGNAVKFTPEKGEVNFTARILKAKEKISPKGGQESPETITLQIEVRDNGAGISPEKQEKLFDIFEQENGSANRVQGGIGIGLALSKRIIEIMGGELSFESQLGVGSVFRFTCELKKAPQALAVLP
ncbi:MAG: ATP-binding protein [Oscillospiraceae bacterium]|nr:ATP-binding protein [Oscillospiraceae bacterium]